MAPSSLTVVTPGLGHLTHRPYCPPPTATLSSLSHRPHSAPSPPACHLELRAVTLRGPHSWCDPREVAPQASVSYLPDEQAPYLQSTGLGS